jgi:hypothetical protein
MKAILNLNPSANMISTNSLSVGEMLIVIATGSLNGNVILKIEGGYVNLHDASTPYLRTNLNLFGRKLERGESITLIQE